MALGDATDNVATTSQVEVVAPGGDIVDASAQEAPSPRVLARQVVPSTARGEQQLGGPNIISDSSNQRIRVNDGTIDRVVMGNINNGQWGLKVSQPGIDATTATDDQLIFNSQQNILKIVASGIATIGLPATLVTNTSAVAIVPHNLGGIPVAQGYSTGNGTLGLDDLVANQYGVLPLIIPLYSAGTPIAGFFRLRIYTDAVNLYASFDNRTAFDLTGVGGKTIGVKYYIFQETAA